MKEIYMRIILLLTVWALSLNAANAQWELVGLSGQQMLCVGARGSYIYAGTDNDVMYVSSNHGLNWSSGGTGLTPAVYSSISFIGPAVFVATECCGVYSSVNNGGLWEAANGGITDAYLYIIASSGTNLFTGSRNVYFSADSGANWTEESNGMPQAIGVLALATSDSTVFAGTRNGLYRSTDNGGTWVAVDSGLPDIGGQYPSFFAVGINGSNIFAGADVNGPYLSTNNGISWTPVNTGLPTTFGNYPLALSFAFSGNYILMATQFDGAFLSTNNGSTWMPVDSGLPYDSATTVYSLSLNDSVIYAGTNSGVYRISVADLPAAGCNLAPPQITSNVNTVCYNDSARICAPAGFVSYQWNNSDTSACIQAKQAANYYVMVTDSNGCRAQSDTISISVFPFPDFEVGTDLGTICAGDSTPVCASAGFVAYHWNFGGTDSCIQARVSGFYYVILTDSNGCTDTSASIPITVYPPSTVTIMQHGIGRFYIPVVQKR
jgi:hypothetical protein